MNIYDIIGPVMVGPSSSHTAGAVRIGYVARRLLGEPVRSANILLYGSFLATGRGHGTDRAIVAGLLGMTADDERVPESLSIAQNSDLHITFGEAVLKEAHPNTAVVQMQGVTGRELVVQACSLGGGRILINRIDGLEANFGAEYPTLIVRNMDRPGCVALVTKLLAELEVNIGTMQLYRDSRGGNAVMVIECDRELPADAIAWLKKQEGISKVTYYSLIA